jgi:hypothetical protein
VKRKEILLLIVIIGILVVLVGCTSTGLGKGKKGGGKKIKPQCNDKKDNDGDGYCDFLTKKTRCNDGSTPGDPGCISKDDNDESNDCEPACNANKECGTNSYVGDPYCGGDGNVYRDYQSFICENAGKCSAVCNEQRDSLLWQNCGGLGCSNGECNTCTPACNMSSDCGTTSWGNPYCGGDGNVYRDYIMYICQNPGTCSAQCDTLTNQSLWQNCGGNGCSNGQCNFPSNETINSTG